MARVVRHGRRRLRRAGFRERARSLYDRSPVHTQIVRYRSVAADFYRNDHDHMARAASFDSWQRVVEWLDLRVAPRPTPLAEVWERGHSGMNAVASNCRHDEGMGGTDV